MDFSRYLRFVWFVDQSPVQEENRKSRAVFEQVVQKKKINHGLHSYKKGLEFLLDDLGALVCIFFPENLGVAGDAVANLAGFLALPKTDAKHFGAVQVQVLQRPDYQKII